MSTHGLSSSSFFPSSLLFLLSPSPHAPDSEKDMRVEVARQREVKWLDMFRNWDKWVKQRFQKVRCPHTSPVQSATCRPQAEVRRLSWQQSQAERQISHGALVALKPVGGATCWSGREAVASRWLVAESVCACVCAGEAALQEGHPLVAQGQSLADAVQQPGAAGRQPRQVPGITIIRASRP